MSGDRAPPMFCSQRYSLGTKSQKKGQLSISQKFLTHTKEDSIFLRDKENVHGMLKKIDLVLKQCKIRIS